MVSPSPGPLFEINSLHGVTQDIGNGGKQMRLGTFGLRASLTFTVTAVLCAAMGAQAGSAFDHVNGPVYVKAMKIYYGAHANTVQRQKIIDAAKEECGGRYEGTELSATELSHETVLDKEVTNSPTPGNYQLKIKAKTVNKWLVIETIKCSMHGGHNKSVLHARIVSGTEKMDINYVYVGDVQQGDETVTNVLRTFSLGTPTLTTQYATPYGTKIP